MRSIALLMFVCAAGCLESQPGSKLADLTAEGCDYQIRCGLIGASERAACLDGLTPNIILDGLGLTPDTALYRAEEALDAGRLRLDAELDEACRAAVTGPCGVAIIACRLRFVGATPPESMCRASLECINGACELDGETVVAGCAGACARDLAVGERCDTGGVCVDGSYCDFTSALCTTLVAPGDPCGSGLCQSGHYCIEGTCATLPTRGQPCGEGLLLCDFGLFCIDGTCAEPGPVGARCAVASGLGALGVSACVDGYCDATVEAPICRAFIADGQVCTGSGQCAGGHPCVGLELGPDMAVTNPGRCGPWADIGEACDASGVTGCPYSALCDLNACVVKDRPVVEDPVCD